ncbi:MAG: arabinogalactan endo,4-beta-galactosidase [Glaciihabitans sp.]|nr:arabinogalactan endo,4-beta-galactosidase [Glaciihabitans sp.]
MRFLPRSRVGIVLLATVLIVAIGVIVLASQDHTGGRGALSIRGADISFTLQNEAGGNTVSDGNGAQPIETILASHGANYMRVRVWVDPPAGTSDLATALTLGRRAAEAGLSIILDLHYSDSWADRTTQTTPASWAQQDAVTLQRTVEGYTRTVVTAFAEQGTPVKIVQIGNEITHGMLWPVGRIYGATGEEDWSGLTGLLTAAIAGARSASPGDAPSIMLDIDTGGDLGGTMYFFDHIVAAGIDFDLIGLTYYPFWNGSLDVLGDTLAVVAERYDRDILIAETSYPYTLVDADDEPNVLSDASALPDGERYPPSEEGQRAYYAALRATLAAVPDGRGVGFLVWEPGWLAGVGAGVDLGNAFDNLTLFDQKGRGLPALDAFSGS